MTDKKNILCVSVMQSWGGGEEFLLNLCKNVEEYDFFVASPQGKAFEIFKENGVRLIPVNRLKKIYRSNQKWTIISKAKILFNVILSAFSLIKIIKSKNIDLILANGNFAGLYVLPAKILAKKNVVVAQHLIYKENSTEGRIINILNKYSDKLVCVSNAVAENIKSFIKNSSHDKITVIHNGVGIPEVKNERKDICEIKIGMVGSIIRIKGIGLVLEALKEMLIQQSNIKLHIYGDNILDLDSIKYKTELESFVKANNIASKVVFHGLVQSKDKLYDDFDILINFTVIPEAFPVSILEAMSYKKIVIAQNEGGPKEIINDKINGFLIGKGNSVHLNDSVSYIIKNFHSEQIEKLRNNARQSVVDNFNLQKFSERYEELFDKLIIKK